jgi:hypothetical protein
LEIAHSTDNQPDSEADQQDWPGEVEEMAHDSQALEEKDDSESDEDDGPDGFSATP